MFAELVVAVRLMVLWLHCLVEKYEQAPQAKVEGTQTPDKMNLKTCIAESAYHPEMTPELRVMKLMKKQRFVNGWKAKQHFLLENYTVCLMPYQRIT